MILKLGSKGEDVKHLQTLLGLDPADGDFGPKTEKAVKEYQQSHGLTVDGIVGNKTMEMLENEALGMPFITQDFIDVHITKSPKRKIKYLVIHFTAGSNSKKGAAKANRDVFLKRAASADFCVDDETIIQVNPDPTQYYCWAVGDGKGKYGINNKDCISIEMCSSLDKGTTSKMPNHEGWHISDAVLNNTLWLARYLMNKYKIDIDHVIRHYDATRKACPGLIGWNDGTIYDAVTGKSTGKKNNSDEWLDFKKKL